MSEEPIKCICCDKEQEVLISVEMKNNSIFLHRRGVCQKCLKDEDINKVCTNFEIKSTKERISCGEMDLKAMKDHLKELGGTR